MGSSHLPPQLSTADPVSLFPNLLDEIQIVYFATALRKFRKNVRTVSLLACWLGVCCFYRCLPTVGVVRNSSSGGSVANHDIQALKAYELLSGASVCAGRTDRVACTRRMEVCECLWLRYSTLLQALSVTFKDTVKRTGGETLYLFVLY